MYEIKRDGITMCKQTMEEKDLFKLICSNKNYKIYLDGKDVTNKYKSKKKEQEQ